MPHGKQADQRIVTDASSKRPERLVQTIPLPYKGISEYVEETIRIARRNYSNDPKNTYPSPLLGYELGEAIKHFFEMGQKVKLDGIGIFKVGFSSIGVDQIEDCGSNTISTRRVIFSPETERVVVGQEKKDGKVKQKYVNAITLLKDVVFEETHDNAMNVEPEEPSSSDPEGQG